MKIKSFFAFTSNLDKALITIHYQTKDNVIPASNSVMAKNLFQLSTYFNNSYYERISHQILMFLLPEIDYPSAFSNWMDLALNYSEQNKELAVCGQEALTHYAKINSQYIPNVILAGTLKEFTFPFLNSRFHNQETLFYLCKNKTCLIPNTDYLQINNDLIK